MKRNPARKRHAIPAGQGSPVEPGADVKATGTSWQRRTPAAQAWRHFNVADESRAAGRCRVPILEASVPVGTGKNPVPVKSCVPRHLQPSVSTVSSA